MKVRSVLIALALGTSFAAGGCKSEESAQPKSSDPVAAASQDPAKTTAKEPANEAAAKPTAGTGEAKQTGSSSAGVVAAIMKPYGVCRALLAADNGEGVAACAKDVVEAANAASATAEDGAKEPLAAIASAADSLAAAGADDIDALRSLYGDLSKTVVALLAASPEAAKAYHVFECPMAKGYQRWVQADAKMANPYMGTKMLECGSEVHELHQQH